MSLNDRVEALARGLAERETKHIESIERAQQKAAELHHRVSSAIERFNEVVGASVPYLQVDVSAPRIDDKHLHAVEFDLERGRHRAIVTVKAKGGEYVKRLAINGPTTPIQLQVPTRPVEVKLNEHGEMLAHDTLYNQDW